ncbi:trifunctional serine/threonine-protein kinase/ATP-binding protein/sensor histidine kinase [Pantanalinema sp. GBBB05]|uniref:trifunctional serine/threonine-protein kinase/ATP-binding protein/sensor histidine kinase n=1 Tax=Pantanalinema sp. GBBB05 TaxID=2604139 RepID=UPI001D3637A2|nr:AAA family ATPase [Pantanalinema sp. GBBB05]
MLSTASANLNPFLPHISGYAIVEPLYTGSRTVVYRAIEQSSQRPVIIKLLHQDYPTFHDLLQFRNQYTIAKNLEIPGIVRLYTLESCGNSYALVMEDCGGISLQQYVQEQPLTLEAVLAIAQQLVAILHDLHQQGVIHKDIKPANILIHPVTQQVKLIDFSIASLLPKETLEIRNPSGLEGTLAYLSPEQTGRMNRGIDYRTDFYALGVTLFELLTGQLPFPSSDPMELVHCHLAKTPPNVHELAPEVPVVLSEIVGKLMAKNAEERYQSASGLQYDLQLCLHQWRETGQIARFTIATHDICDRFLIPETLYGRASEVQTLLDAFDRVADGKSELMLVAGFSGIGKTAVVNEVHKPITRQRGYFIKGKFDQFNRNLPLSALVQALRDLLRQLLTESDAQLRLWKTKILEALGENGQVVIDVIPDLELIIGKQPDIPELSGSAAQKRFNLLFQKFIQVFTQKEHPLVIFLDDLQWADLASLQLLQLLMQDNGHLLILGAYRDNEVSPVHPLMLTVDELQANKVIVNTITLSPLMEVTVNQLVADTLNCPGNLARPLTQLVYQKTQGNPFFITQFLKALHEEGWIQLNQTLGYWQCDLASVCQLALTDDIVEFMAVQLQKLPAVTQTALKLAACIGNQFDLPTLAIVSEQSQAETASALWSAVQEGLILPITDAYKFFQGTTSDLSIDQRCLSYKFLHDRVQQAAYSLIADAQKQMTHLQIGRLLWQNVSEAEPSERLFELVNQLNYGIALISEASERQRLAQLNWQAGQKAKEATAYSAALGYFNCGIQLLTSSTPESTNNLLYSLYYAATEAAFLNHDFEQMDALIPLVIQHASQLLDRVKVYEVKLQAYQVQGQPLNAIALGWEILQQLGVSLPKAATPSDSQQAVEQTLASLPTAQIADLVDLLEMTDSQAQVALKIMISIVPSVHQAAPDLFPLLACEEVNLSLKYGNSPLSAPGYADFGIVVNTVLHNLEAGYQFGQLALSVVEKFAAKSMQSMTAMKVAAFNQYNQQPIQSAIELLKQAYNIGLEIGDFVHVFTSTFFRLLYSFLSGTENLADLYAEIKVYQTDFVTIQHFLMWSSVLEQAIENLLVPTEVPTCLRGNACNEVTLLPELIQENDQLTLHIVYLNQLILSYLFEDLPMAIAQADLCRNYLNGGAGMLSVPMFNYYDALARLAIYPTSSDPQQASLLWQVEQNQLVLHDRAQSAPMNFQHKYELVVAERYRVLGDKAQAIDFYDRAIAGAHEHGFIQDEALANELAAKFYLAWGKEKVASGYMQAAYYGYTRWGAQAKIDALVRHYPRLLRPILQPATQPLKILETLVTVTAPHVSMHHSSEQTGGSSTGINATLDFATILKASQTLSSTIQLDELLHQLTQIILQNSGGERCVLILPDHTNEWQVVAIATPTATELCSEPLEGNLNLPAKLIQYVKNTQEVVVVDNLNTDLPVIDDYLIQRQPKSLLGLPILHRGQLIGILYLKNRSTSGVFTHDRILILNFLCTQAAISLENARLYQASQAHTQQVELALEQQKVLFDVVTQMRQSLDLEMIFQSVTQNVRSIFNVDRVGIYQFDAGYNHEYGEFIAEAVQPEFPSALAIKLQDHCFGDNYADLYKQGRICTISDVQAADVKECHRAILMQFEIKASLVVPIMKDNELWGLLCIHQCNRPRNWRPTETQFAQQVAAQLGIALQQTELLLETRRQAMQLEQMLANLRDTQLQLVQNEKMASLGNLVAGVAHEINNPIGFLNGSINNAKEYVQDLLNHLALYQQHHPQTALPVEEHAADIDLEFLCEDLPKLLHSMKGATDRIKSISTSLRTFSRADTEHKVNANLHEGIDSALLILKYRLKANEHRPEITVNKEYGELPLIACFPGQLNQVFMNILANAIDVFDEAAQLLSFKQLEAQPQCITVQTTVLTAQNAVEIRIRDNGQGMTEAVKTRIFDHLFTTKDVGKGTGLGLAIARQIVTETHAGNLEVQSELGQGTEFRIRLPISS